MFLGSYLELEDCRGHENGYFDLVSRHSFSLTLNLRENNQGSHLETDLGIAQIRTR